MFVIPALQKATTALVASRSVPVLLRAVELVTLPELALMPKVPLEEAVELVTLPEGAKMPWLQFELAMEVVMLPLLA